MYIGCRLGPSGEPRSPPSPIFAWRVTTRRDNSSIPTFVVFFVLSCLFLQKEGDSSNLSLGNLYLACCLAIFCGLFFLSSTYSWCGTRINFNTLKIVAILTFGWMAMFLTTLFAVWRGDFERHAEQGTDDGESHRWHSTEWPGSNGWTYYAMMFALVLTTATETFLWARVSRKMTAAFAREVSSVNVKPGVKAS